MFSEKQGLRNKSDTNIPLSVPGPGRTIWSSLQKWIIPLSSAFYALIASAKRKKLSCEIANNYKSTYSPLLFINDGYVPSQEKSVELASSALLSLWMLAHLFLRDQPHLSLSDAEKWFLKDFPKRTAGVSTVPGWLDKNYIDSMLSLPFQEELPYLFPYILEVFEFSPNTSQLSLDDHISNRRLGYSHTIKRRYATFYTPSDVCEYMVNHMITSFNSSCKDMYNDPRNFTWLDPACGTGVFLKAALKGMKQYSHKISQWDSLHITTQYLYGIDTSPQATQSTAFTLLLECLDDIIKKNLSPWRAWHAIRGNIATIDSTVIGGADSLSSKTICNNTISRKIIRESLIDSKVDTDIIYSTIKVQMKRRKKPRLDIVNSNIYPCEIFEEISDGFTFIIGNPPYTRIPSDKLNDKRRKIFTSLPNSNRMSQGNIYTLFVEMMWRFSLKNQSSGGMIVPLSVAYNSREPFRALRRGIQKTEGQWTFIFFDRTPDSIFGDDVKTRNAIIFLTRHNHTGRTIATSSFLRWTSRNRASLFENLRVHTLNTISIEDLIPKIGTKKEMIVYKTLQRKRRNAKKWWHNFSSSKLSAFKRNNEHCVFYYSTAYNWLPILRSIPTLPNSPEARVPRSLRGITFKNEENARFFFSVASSRITYWLWRVEGDGFHLTKDFLKKLPFHPDFFTSEKMCKLQELADELWLELQQYPIKSFNSGQTTINYCPYECGSILDKIDTIIIEMYDLDYNFLDFLKKFLTHNIIVGRERELKRTELDSKLK